MHCSRSFTSSIHALTASLVLLGALTRSVAGLQNMKCQSGPYPYCVHAQSANAPDGGQWPTMVFLPGSGARGSLSNADSLALYDGMGKAIGQYYWGQKGAVETQAAEQFLTIIPIAPDGSRHWDPTNIASIVNTVKSSYNVDTDRIYVSGYSMGGRGTWRQLVFHPEIWAAGAPSAGSAEDVGAGTLQQEAAPATFPLLKNVLDIPIKAFAGKADETAGYADSERTQNQIVSLGGKLSTLTEFEGATHSDMSTKPWFDTDLLTWFLTQSRSGATSNSTTASSSSIPSATRTKSRATSTATAKSASSDDDCEEDGDDSDSNVDDCDDKDKDSGDDSSSDGGDDCDEDSSTTITRTKTRSTKTRTPKSARKHTHTATQIARKRAAGPLRTLAPLSSRQRRASAVRSPRHRRGWHAHRMVEPRKMVRVAKR